MNTKLPVRLLHGVPSSPGRLLAGYWTWRNNRYEWVAGHWEVPPRTGAVWILPRWQPEGT
jgi:hypothetical protein